MSALETLAWGYWHVFVLAPFGRHCRARPDRLFNSSRLCLRTAPDTQQCSDTFVNKLGKQSWRYQGAPLGVVSTGGFSGNHFFQRLPLLFESGYFGAERGQHVPKFNQLRLVSHRTVPGDDRGFIGYFRKVGFGGANHAVDAAASRIVDEGIDAVPPCVAHMEHIGFGEVDGDVAVSMGGRVFNESECHPV